MHWKPGDDEVIHQNARNEKYLNRSSFDSLQCVEVKTMVEIIRLKTPTSTATMHWVHWLGGKPTFTKEIDSQPGSRASLIAPGKSLFFLGSVFALWRLIKATSKLLWADTRTPVKKINIWWQENKYERMAPKTFWVKVAECLREVDVFKNNATLGIVFAHLYR